MKYIDIKEVDKTVKQQNNGGNGCTMRTAWYSALLVLGTALLVLTGCPETPSDQSDTTAPDPISITSANITTGPSSIGLQWEPSPSDDVATVQVTWTPTHGEDQPKLIDIDSTNTTITGLNAGVTYTFSITAIDTSDNVSSVAEISATTASAVLFAQEEYSFTDLDVAPGSTVGSVSATVVSPPADPPITLIYQIIQNDDDDSALFVIDSTTAEITIGTTALDTTRDDYSFTVQVTSSQGVIVTTAVVVSPSLDTTAPDPLTEVSATTTEGTTAVTLSWKNSGSADATTIRIVWIETALGTGGGNRNIAHDGTTTTVITGLTSEVGYTFTLTVLDNAVDAAGDPASNESDPETATATTPDTNAPLSVSSFTATPLASGTEVELSWTNSDSVDAATLEIAWSSSTNDMASGSETIASGTGIGMHTISGLITSTPYTFTITVIDTADNRSPVETADPITTLANPVDADGDTLIDIGSLAQLHNMRYNLAGTSYKTSSNGSDALCGTDAATTCTGYELNQSLTFDRDNDVRTYDLTSYVLDSGDHHATYFPVSGGTGGWLPIGDATNPFSTIFEGNGFFIRGLAVRRNQTYIGMFGRTSSSAIIRNIRLTNNLADYTGNSGTDIYVGGLVAYNAGTIIASHAGGPADGGDGGNDRVGGLVGRNTSTIIASYATGNADGRDGDSDYVGGLVGNNNSSGTITASYATGNADGRDGDSDYVGGLVGNNDSSGTITASYSTGVAHGGNNSDRVGGLVGNNSGAITASYATGNADGGDGNADRVGSLVGNNAGPITASYATGDADGDAGNADRVGSLVGNNAGPITASYGFGSAMNSHFFTVESSLDLDPDDIGAGNNPGIAGARILQAAGGAAGRSVTAAWNQASSNTQNAWDFGTDSQAPALRYTDYDGDGTTYGCGSSSTATIVIPDRVPAPGVTGGVIDVTCGDTLLGGPQSR